MATKDNSAMAGAAAGFAATAEVVHKAPNRVRIRIAFSGNGRECNVDLDSTTGCKTTMSGPMYPDDMALITAIMKLVSDAKTTYPPTS